MPKRKIYLLSPAPKEGTISLPIITFSLLAEKIDFTGSDTLMFTSKQAVLSADAIDPDWKKYPCIAIGPATKKQIEALGGKVIYRPDTFYGKELSKDIAVHFKERKLLYLRPRVVSFDSKSYLQKAGIALNEQVVYETSCVPYSREDVPQKGAVIIFTSPSSIYCFLKSFEWDESYTAVVIGEATKEHLTPRMQYVIADEPMIDSCIEKAKSLSE